MKRKSTPTPPAPLTQKVQTMLSARDAERLNHHAWSQGDRLSAAMRRILVAALDAADAAEVQ